MNILEIASANAGVINSVITERNTCFAYWQFNAKQLEAFAKEIAEQSLNSRWISVDTDLPDYDLVTQKRLRVLVHWKDTGAVFTLWYGKRFGNSEASFYEENDWDESDDGQVDEGDNFLFGDILTFKNITHWQPHPEPPKD